MNDRYDAGYGDDQGNQYALVGYDEYGRPVYQQVQSHQAPQQQYDPYAQQGYGYDPYATGTQQAAPYDTGAQNPVPPPYDPYGADGTGRQAPVPPYDPYGRAAASGQQPRVAEQTAYIPQQGGPTGGTQAGQEYAAGSQQARAEAADGDERQYHTAQFAFVEEPDSDSEDVIDWLNFTENRTERREEAKRRARSRLVALVVVLALVAAGGVGYLWYAGKLPGLSDSESKKGNTIAASAQNRDVIVVHLHNTTKGGTSTALLVDNTTTKQGTTVLIPNSLVLTSDDGSTTTLAKSVDDDGSSGTVDSLDTVLGTDIEGTWRLDTPYLQNLVDLVGNIDVDTNAAVPDPDARKKGQAPLVSKGKDQTLSGKMAVAYATYRASGEAQNAQLERFGQVLQGVLRKLSSDPTAATTTVQTLAQILDPSLTDKDLGTFLAKLADLAKSGDFKTALLPVQQDGTLSAAASASVVKDVLGGKAKSPDKDAAVSVSVQNATGTKDNTEKARVVLLNGGFTFIDGGTPSSARATSKVVYADAADKANATEVAKTLGLPTSAVGKGTISSSANVSVVLGQDYKPDSSS
ncbi:anionic cell wall polymer biosynthesis LytR-Cps2A-Psr (LCP) family protein [Streptomyces sp. SAI-135]|uniref:LytR C-terminal domain-containing protein n=1 Tax=unclassified Streptomyces TaxID=2593676 RepID=UPI002473DEE2|nr:MULTISPECIES: LytR C-terminal domain-containing protein [unclassified Streptomyces]MDH6519119.1 anionic cell wall polymer biosynthesis LytR-Cps2A-Psr (LCP) family protein [Streptomyces sp. SAI-090]MDH6616787.1 anionic cell wall polymer biosynthesis LytR-Cps2A-Psr (LCP) family protein [Streptomyces sp. SAI-135]